MATFSIARLYYSLPLLFSQHSAAQDLGTEPRRSSRGCMWIMDIWAAALEGAERRLACTQSEESKREADSLESRKVPSVRAPAKRFLNQNGEITKVPSGGF